MKTAPGVCQANVLHPGHSIITVEDVLDVEECDALIRFAEGIGFEAAPITTAFGFVMAPEVRDNTRVMVDDPARAERIWARLERVIPTRLGPWVKVGLNERLRFYRYDPGQRFAWHRDGAFVRGPKERSHLTLLVYLNDGFEGGATEIEVNERIDIRPRRGGALLFAHHVRHQGAPVARGRKYVLRSDVMYRHEGGTGGGLRVSDG